MKRLLNFFLKPFDQNFLFFLITFFCSAITECIGFAIFESLSKMMFIALHHFIYAYFIVLVYSILPKRLNSIYKNVIVFILIINFIIDIVCVYSFNFTFDQEIPAIVFGTNINESSEFIDSFISSNLLIIILLGIIIIPSLFLIVRKKRVRFPVIFQYLGVLMVIVCLLLTTVVKKSKNWENVSVGKVLCFTRVWDSADINISKTNPQIVSIGNKRVKNIVLIIGESLAKRHCSLYGYNKHTNPILEKMKEEGSLFVFENAEAPALNTIPSFKCLMSTYESGFGDSVEWNKCTTLPELLNKAHYKSFWISNQAEKGANDNIVSKYAHLFDKVHFTGNRFAAKSKVDMDETVLEILPQYMNERDSLSLFVFHLMGSHPNFECRYPENFSKFVAEDYADKPENQRHNIAAYDNSVLYNDFVVSEIMNRFKDEDAIVFYFPDHGLDVYESKSDYAGHARWNNPKSIKAGKEIPFLIYCTPLFTQNNSCIVENISSSLNHKIYTENIIYTIMNLANYKIEGQKYNKERCLLLNQHKI